MQLLADVAHFAKLVGRNAQLGVDLVDHGAGAARALVVHRRQLLLFAGLRIFLEDDDLRVLTAEFDHRSALGIQLLDRERNGVHFLHELRADVLRQARSAGTGDEDAEIFVRSVGQVLLDLLQHLQHLFRLLGFVALVVSPENLVGFAVDHDDLHGRRADIGTHPEHVVLFLRIGFFSQSWHVAPLKSLSATTVGH